MAMTRLQLIALSSLKGDRKVVAPIANPSQLAWLITKKAVMENLQIKRGCKISEEDKEYIDILKKFSKIHKEYWGIDKADD